MGILKGDVDILGLGNLLQLLSMNKREGTLTLLKGSDKKTIHFATQGIRLLSSSMRRVNKLGKILLRRRRITGPDLDALLKEQKLLGWKLGQIAMTSGLVKKQDIEDALREQIEEEIFDMFMWTDAAFEFAEGRTAHAHAADNPLAGMTFGGNITSLLLEAARRNDELLMTRRIFHDDEMRLQKFNFEIHADELGGEVEVIDHVLPLINGKGTLRDVINQSIYPRFSTMRAVYALFTRGYIKAHDRKGQAVQIPKTAERVR